MKLKQLANSAGLALRKHSPEILGAVGMVATVVGVVWACKATVDAADDIKECKEEVAGVKEARDTYETIDKKEASKRIWHARIDCAKKVGVKYAGPVAVVGAGLYFQYKGRSILGKRLNSLAAAYTALESRYKLLEDNIRRDYGEEELNRLKYGLRSQKGIVRVPDDVGNERDELQTVNGVTDLDNVSKFTIIFDHGSGRHHTSKYHCEQELIAAEKSLTGILQRDKVLWLDRAMHILDIHPRNAQEAQLWHSICWTYKPGVEGHDNEVKLRWKQVIEPDAEQFDVDYNPVYVLDPNYDTNMYQKWYQPRG